MESLQGLNEPRSFQELPFGPLILKGKKKEEKKQKNVTGVCVTPVQCRTVQFSFQVFLRQNVKHIPLEKYRVKSCKT